MFPMGGLIFGWLLCLIGSLSSAAESCERFEFSQTEMAVPMRIVIYHANNATAAKAAAAAFFRIHQLNAILSDYDPQSELRRLCDTAGQQKPVRVSDDLWRVLVRADELARESNGAFDPTVGPVVRLWRSARRTKELPSPESLERAMARVGYRLVRLDPQQQTVELLKPKMRLDLGGIAKGYAVDEAMGVLRRHGVTRMMVEAGGNIGLGEPPPGKPGWRIGIAPPKPGSPPREYRMLACCSLSTSGDMWQYAVIAGTRYSHLVDPRTGRAMTDSCSVTVVGPSGLSTDGLSCAVAILGPEQGFKLIESTPDTAALFVRNVDGQEQTFESKGWREVGK